MELTDFRLFLTYLNKFRNPYQGQLCVIIFFPKLPEFSFAYSYQCVYLWMLNSQGLYTADTNSGSNMTSLEGCEFVRFMILSEIKYID